jgi:hypothetical protein
MSVLLQKCDNRVRELNINSHSHSPVTVLQLSSNLHTCVTGMLHA